MDLNNIVGFKAVDKNGKERQVTVDEMTELVSARIVSAASEISTFAAAAAAGTDEFEDQLPQSDTFSWLRTLDGSKNPTLTSSSAAAKVLGGLLGVSSSTIFKGKGYIQLKTEDDIDKVYEPGVYAIKGTSYNDQTLLVFSHNLGQSTVQFRTNNYGGFLVFRIKWWNGGWGTWKTVSLT
jgi:hypothetical protein